MSDCEVTVSTGTFWENWLRSDSLSVVWQRKIEILCGITKMYWGQGSRWIYLEIHLCDILQKWVSPLLWLGWYLKLVLFNLQVPLLSSKLRSKGTFSFIKYVLFHSTSCGCQGLASFLRLTNALEIWRGGCSTEGDLAELSSLEAWACFTAV